MRLGLKLSLLTVGLITAVVGSIAFTVDRAQRRSLEAASERRLETMLEGVARIAQEAFAARDELMLASYLMFLHKEHAELAFAAITRRGHTATIGQDREGLRYLESSIQDRGLAATYTVAAAPEPPVSADAAETVHVRLGFDSEALRANIESALAPLRRRTLALAAGFLGAGLVGAFALAALITRPLTALATAAAAVGRGRLDVQAPAGGADELGVLASSFNEMTARLRESRRLREDMLHALTHDLNTPMAWLRGYLEMWEQGRLPSRRQSEVIEVLQAGSVQMEDSIANTLRLFEEGPPRFGAPSPVALHELVGEVYARYRPLAASKGLVFRNAASVAPVWVHAPEEAARDIVGCLVAYAFKQVREQGLVLVGLKEEGGGAVFWAAHTGQGVSPSDMPHVFSRLYRVRREGGFPERIPGSGLELRMAKRAAEALGGRIWMESELVVGSVVFVSLPKGGAQTPPAEGS